MSLSIFFSWLVLMASANPLMEAKDIQDFLLAEQQWVKQQNWKKACDHEQGNDQFPLNCFKWLEEKIIDHEHQVEIADFFVRVNKRCPQMVSDLKNQEQVRQVLQLSSVASQCRKALEVRLGDLEYRDGSFWHPL